MLSGGIAPAFQTITPTPQTSALQPGQSYAGVIRAQNAALVVQLAGLQIPLDDAAGLTAGQRVLVHVRAAGNALQLEIAPAAPTAIAGSGPPSLDAMLRPLLQALGKLDLSSRAAVLLPQQLPAGTGTLQPLLTLLLSDRALGQELQQLHQILNSAASQGALPPNTAAAVLQWLGLAPGGTPDAWRQLIDRARSERAAVARLAQSQGGSGLAALRDSAASLVRQLLTNVEFQSWLRGQGALESFTALARRIQDRAQGSELQNLRGLDQPYEFLEIPVREADGFYRLHVHNFSEQRAGTKQAPRPIHRTVIDIETTRLGPLWIALEASGNQCACRIRAAAEPVVALFEESLPELHAALTALGYPNPAVTATLWNGNREEALLDVFAPYQKLDLEG